jgi:ABC-type phosphate/phosphonate transport system substrate-binding protein
MTVTSIAYFRHLLTITPRFASIAAFALTLIVTAPATAQGTLRASAIPDEAPDVLQRKFVPLGRYLAERTGMSVQFVPATDYPTVVQSLANGKIDLAWLGGYTYLQAMETSHGAVIALVQREEDQQFKTKPAPGAQGPLIAAAADLRFALPEVVNLFWESTGQACPPACSRYADHLGRP